MDEDREEGYAELEEESVDERPIVMVELEAAAEVNDGALPEVVAVSCPTTNVIIGNEARITERVYFMISVGISNLGKTVATTSGDLQ